MKYLFFLLIILLPLQSLAASESLADRLSGKILLQVESYGRAWYIDPVTKQKYYMKDGPAAYEIMRYMSLGISNKDLAKIPTTTGQHGDYNLVERLKGRILLQVEEKGEAWYVNPDDGIRYYLKDGPTAYKLMRQFALGISNEDLSKITMNKTQVVHDTCFDDVAYVSYDGQTFQDAYNADQILPLASMTKLMTAMVLLDLDPDWNKEITITQEILDYPKLYVGEDATSEVGLSVGDTMSFYDLWVAMLVASSNQAAAALYSSTDLNKPDFVKLMNNKAEEFGLVKTAFYDVAGLDAHNVTTPKEMAIIADHAFVMPKILEADKEQDYTIFAKDKDGQTKEIKVIDRNYSLKNYEAEAFKTGYLVEAQRTVAFKKNNKIFVIMHARSMPERNTIIEKLLDIK